MNLVMPALVAGIHVFRCRENADGRDKPGHDDEITMRLDQRFLRRRTTMSTRAIS
jgi:hypothetical protein